MNFFLKASIKRKQVLIIMAITAVALLLACASFTAYEIMAFRSAMVGNLSALAGIIGNNTSGALDFDDSKAAEETLSALKAESHIVGACIYTADGRVFATYTRPNSGATFAPPPEPPARDHSFRNGDLTLWRLIYSKGDAVGTVYLVSDMRELYSRLGQYAGIIAAVLVLTLMVALVLSSRLQRFISEPILRLAGAARAVGQNQDYTIRVEKHNPDEIGVLIDGFNGMLGQIQNRDLELQKAKDVLEMRVKERTAELAGANTALQQENLERKQAEKALRSQEERTRMIIDQAFDAVITTDNDYRIIGWNRQAERTLGWTREEILGRVLVETVVAPSRREVRGKDLERFKATGEWADLNRLIQTTAMHRDGRELPVELTMTPIRLGENSIFTIFIRDITERKQAEDALARERHLLESLLENSQDCIYFKDRESRILRCSKALSQRYAGGAAELIGKTDFDLFAEEHARPAFEDEQEIIRTGCPLIGKVEKEVAKDGRESWALTSKMPLRNKAGEIVGTFGISKDITAIKQAEAELAYERDLLRTLLDNSPDSIFFKDLQSRLVELSSSEAANLWKVALSRHCAAHPGGRPEELPPHLASLGQFREYIIGKTDADTYGHERAASFRQDEQEIMRTGQPIIGKIEQTACPDGTAIWYMTTKVPWHNKDGKIIGTFGTSREISDLKNAEARIEEAHKRLLEVSRQAGMAEVATNVLHNVGNVLNSVNVSATLVVDNTKKSKVPYLGKIVALLNEHAADLGVFMTTDPKGRELPGYLSQLADQLTRDQQNAIQEHELLRQNIEHIKDIVAMQQSYARISGVTEPLNVTGLVEDALRMNAQALDQHEVELIREYTNVPPVTTEKHKVLQILVNLIQNAKYACDDSGRKDKQLRLQVSKTDNGVQVAVVDNGIGILPENLTRIFNHGFTTRKDGHGFGLHSGALAAKELGGSLTADSEGPGLGSIFTLELPFQPPSCDRVKTDQGQPGNVLATL